MTNHRTQTTQNAGKTNINKEAKFEFQPNVAEPKSKKRCGNINTGGNQEASNFYLCSRRMEEVNLAETACMQFCQNGSMQPALAQCRIIKKGLASNPEMQADGSAQHLHG